VRPLVFNETLIADFKNAPGAADINNGFSMGLRWRQKPNGNYELTRLSAGRVVVTNFDPMALTDQQRSELNEKIKKTQVDLSIWIFSQMDRVESFLFKARSSYGACFRFLTSSPRVLGSPQSSRLALTCPLKRRKWSRSDIQD
jgi:hypothetical protein